MKDKGDLETAAQEFLQNPDDKNLDTLMEKARGLILHFVRKYGLDRFQEDLIQAGYEGLIKAVRDYDPQKGAAFVTYASHWIIGEIRHEIRRQRRFECPGVLVEVQNKVGRVVDDYFKKNGELPSPKTIAREINIKEEGVLEALQGGLVSLDELDLSKIKSINRENFQLPVEDKLTLFWALRKLSLLQRKVLYHLFFQNKTQEETAQLLNTSQRQVSRIKEEGLKNIREKLKESV